MGKNSRPGTASGIIAVELCTVPAALFRLFPPNGSTSPFYGMVVFGGDIMLQVACGVDSIGYRVSKSSLSWNTFGQR
jgi:hypothetical protein